MELPKSQPETTRSKHCESLITDLTNEPFIAMTAQALRINNRRSTSGAKG
jgi:hypothetical protein